MPPYIAPLDKFLGFGVQSPTSDEEDAKQEDQNRQVEQQIATCMQAQGFDYVPYNLDSDPKAKDPFSLPPKEFAEQYGYGITTVDATPDQNSDPNAAIRAAMTIPQLRAYYKALYGDLITIDDNGQFVKRARTGPVPANANADACSVKASTAVYGSQAQTQTTQPPDPFTALEHSIGALSQSIDNDPRVIAATATWSGCMADAGHPGYKEKDDAATDVGNRADQLRGNAQDFSKVDPAALQTLRQYEISVAVADYSCGLAYDSVHQAVETELENTFIDENRAELEQYRDALAAGTVGEG
jgi:hypothetical protein